MVGLQAFFAFLFILARARHDCRATNWRSVLVTAFWTVEPIAPLMKPWCAERDVPTAANVNLYRGRNSQVGWHSDDGTSPWRVWGGEAQCVGELWDPCPLEVEEHVHTLKQARAGLAMVTLLSWMVNARTSFFTARIPVCKGKGLMLRSVGSGGVLLPVLCGQG